MQPLPTGAARWAGRTPASRKGMHSRSTNCYCGIAAPIGGAVRHQQSSPDAMAHAGWNKLLRHSHNACFPHTEPHLQHRERPGHVGGRTCGVLHTRSRQGRQANVNGAGGWDHVQLSTAHLKAK